MVADIHLLQGKIVEDPESSSHNRKNIPRLIEELELEILSEEDLAQAATVDRSHS